MDYVPIMIIFFAAGWSRFPIENLLVRAPRHFSVGVPYCYLKVRKLFQKHELSLVANRKEIKLEKNKKKEKPLGIRQPSPHAATLLWDWGDAWAVTGPHTLL